MDKVKLNINVEIVPCCSPESTYVEIDLSGSIFQISCFECEKEISFNNTNNIIEDWNRSMLEVKNG